MGKIHVLAPRNHGYGTDMSHLYDTIEPNVVSEALLRQCVAAQGPEGEAGRIAKKEGTDFADVSRLRLDFQNILHIDNLWQFTGLCHLQLDNNIIEEVKGLENLTQLQWLDLSFNNITTISGLSSLTNLTDLSLAHNRINKIENLDSLTKLQVFSIASNLVSEFQNVMYLRQFPLLQSLALTGNPLAGEEHYQSYVIAFVPSLVYLDFRMVMEEERCTAREVFHEELQEVELAERENKRRREEEEARDRQEQLYKAAYVDGLQSSVLFDAMFAEDTDSVHLRALPDVAEMLDKYQKDFVECCEHITAVGLQEGERRRKEVEGFHRCHEEACSVNQQNSVQRIGCYEQRGEKLSGEALQEATDSLQHDLMRLEMQLVEQLEEITKDFEHNYSDMVGGFLEQVQSHMTQLRGLENTHHERLTEQGLELLEQAVKTSLEETVPEGCRMLFVDKDTLVGALNAAHDLHMLAIDSKEDKIASRVRKDLAALLKSLQEEELTRSRKRVVEIEHYVQQQKEEVELPSS